MNCLCGNFCLIKIQTRSRERASHLTPVDVDVKNVNEFRTEILTEVIIIKIFIISRNVKLDEIEHF